MQQNFRSLKLAVVMAVTVFASTLALAQVSPSEPEPGTSYTEVDQIKAAVFSGNTFRAVQAVKAAVTQLDADQLNTSAKVDEVKAALTQLIDVAATELAKVEAQNASILSQAQSNGKQIVVVLSKEDQIAAGQAAIASGVSGIASSVSSLSSKVDADEAARVSDDVAGQLRANKYETNLYAPASQGGRLDVVREVATCASNAAAAKGWQNEESNRYLAEANKDYAAGDYRGALDNYGKAYRLVEGYLAHKFSPFAWYLSTFH